MGLDIASSDGRRVLSVGSYSFWDSFVQTVKANMTRVEERVPHALAFLNDCSCDSKDALATARELNVIRDALSQVAPSAARNSQGEALDESMIAPAVTSCGNLFTTSEGEDLLSELVGLLCYAHACDVDVAPV